MFTRVGLGGAGNGETTAGGTTVGRFVRVRDTRRSVRGTPVPDGALQPAQVATRMTTEGHFEGRFDNEGKNPHSLRAAVPRRRSTRIEPTQTASGICHRGGAVASPLSGSQAERKPDVCGVAIVSRMFPVNSTVSGVFPDQAAMAPRSMACALGHRSAG
jgi:hypothetical protein